LEQNDLPSPKEEDLAHRYPELDAALLGERDERLLAALYRLHEERNSEDIEVAVVYGAAHVPAIVEGLRDRYGYRARSADWLTVADL
jgi:pheromone shutdown protein TraB